MKPHKPFAADPAIDNPVPPLAGSPSSQDATPVSAAPDSVESLKAQLEDMRRQLEDVRANALIQTSDNSELLVGHDDETGEEIYSYRIDLPPSGGQDIKINGHPFYHGETYRVRASTLRSLKEIVYRTRQHENSIRGSNENFYRRETAQRI